jgi:hypothetical protein
MPDSVATVRLNEGYLEQDRMGTLTETLLSQRKFFQLIEAVSFRGTINHGVFEKITVHAVVVHGTFHRTSLIAVRLLQLIRVPTLVVNEARVVIALV